MDTAVPADLRQQLAIDSESGEFIAARVRSHQHSL